METPPRKEKIVEGKKFESYRDFYDEYIKKNNPHVFIVGKSLVKREGEDAKSSFELVDDPEAKTKIIFYKIGAQYASVNVYEENQIVHWFRLDNKNITDYRFFMESVL